MENILPFWENIFKSKMLFGSFLKYFYYHVSSFRL